MGEKLAGKYVFSLDFSKFIASRATDLNLRNDSQFGVKKTLKYTAIKDTDLPKSNDANTSGIPAFIMDRLHAVNMVYVTA